MAIVPITSRPRFRFVARSCCELGNVDATRWKSEGVSELTPLGFQVSGQMEKYVTNLDFPEIRGISPTKPPFGVKRSM